MKKLFVFLRHNNDIDHITPVLYKWLKTEDIPVEVIFTTHRYFLDDYRMKLLKDMGDIKIRFITDSFKRFSIPNMYIYLYDKYYTPIDKYTDRYSYVKKKIDIAIKNMADDIFSDAEGSVVCFDWVINYFVNQMIIHAKSYGFPVVSLPHGDAPYINQLETISQINFDEVYDIKTEKIRSHLHQVHKMDVFDYVVVPNWIVERRYKHMKPEKVKTLGSPRYCDEWMKIHDDFVNGYQVENNLDRGKFKVVLLLRNICYPIYWEGVAESIRLLLQFPDTYIVVKPHARSRRDRVIEYRIINSCFALKKHIPDNLSFAYNDTNALSLVKWADVVLDLGTSMIWEPVKTGKPVLCMDYLHSNISTVSHYIDGCSMTTRDKLYQTFERLHNDKNVEGFYPPKQCKKFIKEIIDVPDKDVLGRYVGFLKELF